MDQKPQRTALYRHFDADGGLLYVGISLSPTYRLSQHRVASGWFDQIGEIKVQWFDTREEAVTAERDAVRAERPKFNVMLQEKKRPNIRQRDAMIVESREQLVRSFVQFRPAYSIQEAAEALCIRTHAIADAIAAGRLSHYTYGKKTLISGWALLAFLESMQDGEHLQSQVEQRLAVA